MSEPTITAPGARGHRTPSTLSTGALLPEDVAALQERITTNVLFATKHGSALYGFQHEKSDRDWFVVTDSTAPRAKHSVRTLGDGSQVDIAYLGLKRFLTHVHNGSHQSVEAAFSRSLVFTPAGEQYRALLTGMRICSPEVESAYKRTIKAFSFGDFKRRRHAVRLTGNLHDLRLYGRFNPEMTYREAASASALAENIAGHALAGILLAQF